MTYALQDEDQEDDVAGPGNGYVDAYDTSGNLIRRVASGGELNSPWGLALAPENFGRFSGDLLIGNFGDGRIHAFDLAQLTSDGEFEAVGLLHSASGKPIKIEGLWALHSVTAPAPTVRQIRCSLPLDQGTRNTDCSDRWLTCLRQAGNDLTFVNHS